MTFGQSQHNAYYVSTGYYIMRTMMVDTMFVAGIQFLNVANFEIFLIALVVLNKKWALLLYPYIYSWHFSFRVLQIL